jgi:hypothetical protein
MSDPKAGPIRPAFFGSRGVPTTAAPQKAPYHMRFVPCAFDALCAMRLGRITWSWRVTFLEPNKLLVFIISIARLDRAFLCNTLPRNL